VVLWRVTSQAEFLAEHVVGRVLRFCGSPLFQTRVSRMADMLRGAAYTDSPFLQFNREFDAVLHQSLPLPHPRRPRLLGSDGHHLRSYLSAGLPGHRGTDLCYFTLSQHIVGFIAPRIAESLTCCVCELGQRRADVGEWRRCAACTNGALLDICFGPGRVSPVPDRAILPPCDDDGDENLVQLVPEGSPWERW